jgi:hypothetical protein
LGLCADGGSVALVSKQEALYLTDFRDHRPKLLTGAQWDFVCKLGPRAFETISGEVVNVILLGLTLNEARDLHRFAGIDASAAKTPQEKATALQSYPVLSTSQSAQLQNPDAIIVLGDPLGKTFLGNYANAWQGIATSDLPRFGRNFWEVVTVDGGWIFQQSVPETGLFGGRENILFWQDGRGAITEVCQKGATFRGQSAWGSLGVVIGQMSSLPTCLYTGERFSNTVAVLVPFNQEHLLPIFEYCRSDEFRRVMRRVNPKLNVDNGYISKVPFDIERWQHAASQSFPQGLPKAEATDPAQWLFDGKAPDSGCPLHVSVAKLLGYRWPRERGSVFYGYPSVERDEADAQVANDGIVCLSSISGEPPAADQLKALLARAFGKEWSSERLATLLGKYESLDVWLRDRWFEEHCSLFNNRPFVWHIWDGRQDGFHALVNYHKLAGPKGEGRKTLEKLIYTSLGDWITRQQAEVVSGAGGAEGRLAAAKHLRSELINILNGEPPYDLFIRWKALHEQPLGWEPDLNDGVRLNMRPWLAAKPYQEPNQKLKQGACILRVAPVKLPVGKDRGKEPFRDGNDFPWYATSQDRTNDEHFTLAQKRAAREQKKRS